MFLQKCKYLGKEKKKSKFILMILMNKTEYKRVLGVASSLMKYQKCFKLGAQKFHFPEYKKVLCLFSRANFLYFSSFGWKVQVFISANIKNAFFWENIRKAFPENVSEFVLMLELESFTSENIRSFFGFFEFGLGSVPGSPKTILLNHPIENFIIYMYVHIFVSI